MSGNTYVLIPHFYIVTLGFTGVSIFQNVKIAYPCTPHFYNIKVGCKGVFISPTLFPRWFNLFKPGVPFMGHRQTE